MDPQGRSVVSDLSTRLLNIKRGELPLALLSALFFFCVLCGYFFLRPVREALGVSRGMDDLRWLFVGSSIASLVAVLAFGGIVNRLDRRRFIPLAFLFVIVCLIAFASLLIADAWREAAGSSARIPEPVFHSPWGTPISSGWA